MHHTRALALACVTALAAGVTPIHAGPTPLLRLANYGTWTSHHENVLGTSLEITLRAPSEAAAERAERAALAEFDRQSTILSAWNNDSEFGRWQRTGGAAVAMSPELLQTLASFELWQHRTRGLLNAAAADAGQVWQAAAQRGAAPTAQMLQESSARMNQPHWQLDVARGTATRLTATPLVLASVAKSRIASAAADAALRAGASGVMLNVGGDIVLRGALSQRIDIADPAADAENAPPLDSLLLRDRSVATSGGYRRGTMLNGAMLSHLIDPRTAQPAAAVLSATVASADADEAGALATALAIASPAEAHILLADRPQADALVLYRSGQRLQTAGWARLQQPAIVPAVFHPGVRPIAPPSTAAVWNQNDALTVRFTLPRMDDPRYRRPYVAVWIEDENKFPVRTLALWFQKPKWLPELKTWYRDDQVRNLAEGTDLSATISSATRPPGTYTLTWDGKDDEGKLVKPGRYTVCVEAAREHGGYGLSRYSMDFDGKPQQAELPSQPEIGVVQLQYARK